MQHNLFTKENALEFNVKNSSSILFYLSIYFKFSK